MGEAEKILLELRKYWAPRRRRLLGPSWKEGRKGSDGRENSTERKERRGKGESQEREISSEK